MDWRRIAAEARRSASGVVEMSEKSGLKVMVLALRREVVEDQR
jgi:hypothetical protein